MTEKETQIKMNEESPENSTEDTQSDKELIKRMSQELVDALNKSQNTPS